jgi:rRNA maturation protein Nop10
MSQTKYLKGACTHCGGHLEFPAESTGMSTTCPHCGQETELLLLPPRSEPTIPRKTLIWTLIAVAVLGLGLAGALYALHLAHKEFGAKPEAAPAVTSTAPAPPPVANDSAAKAGFSAGPVSLEKEKGSTLVYATGMLTNLQPKQRFGVKVELELTNAAGEKIGNASDYQRVIESKGAWQFRALVVEPKKAKGAKVANVTEQE